jgi:hypothetical protein
VRALPPALVAVIAVIAVLALALPPPAPAAAQGGESAAFGERIEVELVGVEVWVTDREGVPVQGLDADDFTVLHDGRPVTVSHFSEVRSGAVVAPAAVAGDRAPAAAGLPAPEAEAPGHLVLYFDQDRLGRARRPGCRSGGHRFRP